MKNAISPSNPRRAHRRGRLPDAQCQFALSGRYKYRRVKADGSLVEESEFFDNLITNFGKNQWISSANGNLSFSPCVGTGNTTPQAADLVLAAFLAGVSGSSAHQSSPQVINFTSAPYYMRRTYTWRFGLGVAAGNISEMGVACNNAGPMGAPTASTSLFSRALVKDANGNPTTVTVLPDEYLDVIWELTIYVATSSAGTTNFSLKGVATPFNWQMGPCCAVGGNSLLGQWDMNPNNANYTNAPYPETNTSTSYSKTRAYRSASGLMGVNNTSPSVGSDAGTQPNADTASAAPYVSNTFFRDFTYGWSLNYGNAAGINLFKLSLGQFGELNLFLGAAGFTKATTDTFSLVIRISVS